MSAEIELVESLYAIFYQQGFLHINVTRLFDREKHPWFEIVTYIPDDEDKDQRLRKLEEALWHIKAFDLCQMIDPKCDRIDSLHLSTPLSKTDITWITEHIGVYLGYAKREGFEDSRKIITLKPGTAFGTGFHPSSRLCIRAMEKHFLPPASFLDVGTGSGILALAARSLGGKDITAIDIDKSSVETARENFELNEAASIELSHSGIGDVQSRYGFVVANMPASILTLNSKYIARAVVSGGILVLSGMIESQTSAVFKSFADRSLEIITEIRDNDWIALVLRSVETKKQGSPLRADF